MIYRIAYTVTYSYTAPVPFGQHLLRVEPGTRVGQRVVDRRTRIAPAPTDLTGRIDFFGNRQAAMTVATPHDTLLIEMTAAVEVARPPWPEEAGPAWETVRAAALQSRDVGPEAPAHFLFPSRRIDLTDPVAEYAAKSFPPGRPILDAVRDLATRVHGDFDYQPGATDAGTLASAAFDARAGVCQDFAQVMIAGLRGLGLPAAYVSGFLRTLPPPGQPRLVGADATHAWVDVWAGPRIGWLGIDPTNATRVANDHIVLGIGRDYADVAPVDGVIVTAGLNDVTVSVDVAPVAPTDPPTAASGRRTGGDPAPVSPP